MERRLEQGRIIFYRWGLRLGVRKCSSRRRGLIGSVPVRYDFRGFGLPTNPDFLTRDPGNLVGMHQRLQRGAICNLHHKWRVVPLKTR